MSSFISIRDIENPSVLSGMGPALLAILMILMGSLHPVFSVAAFLYVCAILLKHEAGGMDLLFLLLPFAGIFKLAPGSTSLFTYLELVYVFWCFAKRRFLLSKADLMVIVLAFCMLVTELMARTVAVTNTVKVLLNLLALEQFLRLSGAELREKTCLWFAAGTMLSSFTSLFLGTIFPIGRFLRLNQVEQYGEYGGSVVRFAGLNADPNYYTVNVILSLCLLIVLYRRRELSTAMTCVLTGILGIFAGLTGSKSALLMLGAVVIIYLVACYQGKHYLMLVVGGIALFLGLEAILSGRIELFNGALLRLRRSMTDIDSFTTGRLGTWVKYLTYFVTRPERIIFGQGVGVYVLDGMAAHNTGLDLIYQLGLVGTGLYLYCLFCMVHRYRRHFRRKFLNYSGMLCVLTMYFFLSQLQGYDLPFHLFLCIALWNTQNEKTDHAETLCGTEGEQLP